MWWHKLRGVLPPTQIDVGLSTDFVHVAVVRGGARAQWHVPCTPNQAGAPVTPPWHAAVETLAQWLKTQDSQPRQLNIRLSGRFVRWQLLPWQAELTGAGERDAFAALRFRENFGTAAQSWRVMLPQLPPGKATPACAVDASLVDALQAACVGSSARIASLTPYFSAAFDRWRARFKGACWFVLLESDCLSFGLIQNADWRCLYSQRLDGDWRGQLPSTLTQAAIACGLGPEVLPIYLAGDLASAPQPLRTPELACDWLAPSYPRGLQSAPGLRLALGV